MSLLGSAGEAAHDNLFAPATAAHPCDPPELDPDIPAEHERRWVCVCGARWLYIRHVVRGRLAGRWHPIPVLAVEGPAGGAG